MRPLWVVSRCSYRACDLVPRLVLQLEQHGYFVRIAEETRGSSDTICALVVLAVRFPFWCPPEGRTDPPMFMAEWLEFIRRASRRCWFARHKWVLERAFKRQDAYRYLWRCKRCGASRVTRTVEEGKKFHGAV